MIAAAVANAVGVDCAPRLIEGAAFALGFWPWIGIFCVAFAATVYAVLKLCDRPKRLGYQAGTVVSALVWTTSLAALCFRYLHDANAGVEWSLYRLGAMWLVGLISVVPILVLVSERWAEWTFADR